MSKSRQARLCADVLARQFDEPTGGRAGKLACALETRAWSYMVSRGTMHLTAHRRFLPRPSMPCMVCKSKYESSWISYLADVALQWGLQIALWPWMSDAAQS